MSFFESESEADVDRFYDTQISAAAIQESQMTAVKLNGRRLILTRLQDDLHAFSQICPMPVPTWPRESCLVIK